MGQPLVRRDGWSLPRVRRPSCTPSPRAFAPFLQVTSLSPPYRHRRRRRPLIANRLSCYPCPRVFYSSIPQRRTWPLLSRWTLVFGLSLYRARACVYLACASCCPCRQPRGHGDESWYPWTAGSYATAPRAMCSVLLVMFSLGPLGTAPECPRATCSPLF